LRHLHPFLPEELGEDFDLDEALRYGTLPVIWTAPDRGEALTAYAHAPGLSPAGLRSQAPSP